MRAQNRLLLFFIVTGAGSVLSAIATFVRIEGVFSGVSGFSDFSNVQILGLALSVKTLAALFVSRLAGPYLSRFGIRRALMHSQGVGLLSLAMLYAGFQSKNLPLVLIGIILSSIPLVLVNVGVISHGRILSQDEGTFRSFSAKVQGALGTYFLIACFVAPVLLKFFGIEVVFALDALSYLLGFWVLARVSDSPALVAKQEVVSQPERNWREVLQGGRRFFLFAGAPLLLSALAPLLASSKSVPFTQSMPELLRESFWSIEAIAILLSGALYGILHRRLQSRIVQAGLMLSSISLFLLFVSSHPIVVAVVMLVNALIFNMAYLKGRDDLIVDEGLTDSKIKSLSSLAFGYKSLIQAGSPILLTWLFSSFQGTQAVWALLATQVICVVLWFATPGLSSAIESQSDPLVLTGVGGK